jgi:hypothetical protein
MLVFIGLTREAGLAALVRRTIVALQRFPLVYNFNG